MTFKEKILAAFKTKFPLINLSKKRLDAIADSVEKKIIDDETKIDATLDDFNSYHPFANIAKDDDRIRDLQAKLKPSDKSPTEKDHDKKDEKPEGGKQESTGADELDPEMPKWAKGFMTQFQTMAQKVAAIESKEQKQTLVQKIESQLKDIPKTFWNKRVLPEKEEDIENFVTEAKTDFEEMSGALPNDSLNFMKPPAGNGGGGNGTKKSEKVNADILKFLDKQPELKAPVKA